MNKKEKRLALKSALSYKVLDKELVVIDNINFETNKTKEMVSLLESLKLTNNKVLVCVNELTDNICLAARNLANVKIVLPSEVNTFDVKYAFKVLNKANKTEVKQAIEKKFNVKVKSVNISNSHPKKKRVGKYTGMTNKYKKAIVTLEKGSTISFD